MKKYRTLSIVAATALLMSGTSVMAEENANFTTYGVNSHASNGTASFGVGAGYNEVTYGGISNTMIGQYAGAVNRGNHNTYIGNSSGYGSVGWGGQNVAVGSQSSYIGGGSYNVMLGYSSGHDSYASNSVYLGYMAGYDNVRDNTLYIENSDSSSPLIYGEFDTKMLRVNGTMEINSTKFLASEPGQPEAYGYPALRLNAFDLPKTQMDWVIGLIHEPTAEPYPKGELVFYNAATDKVPFSITNGAEHYLLQLVESSVVINYNDELDETLIGTASLLVNGNILSTGAITSQLAVTNSLNREFPMALSRENNGTGHSDVGFSLENKTDGGGFKWTFQTAYQSEGFTATKIGTGGYEFAVKNPTDDVDNVELAAAGKVFFTGGHLQDPSSRTYKDDIKTLDTKTALEAFEKLEPVTFVYKEHKDDQVVGFIAEDVPELLAMKGRKGINPTEIVAVLTKVVQTQDAEMKAMKAEYDAKIALQNNKISKLELMQQKVAQLESILTNLALDTSHTQKEKVSVTLK